MSPQTDEWEDETPRFVIDEEFRHKMEAGDQAYKAIKKNVEDQWLQWKIVGVQFQELRRAAFAMSGTNDIQSPVYKKQLKALASRQATHEIDSSTRSKLLDLMDHLDEVEDWRNGLMEQKR